METVEQVTLDIGQNDGESRNTASDVHRYLILVDLYLSFRRTVVVAFEHCDKPRCRIYGM